MYRLHSGQNATIRQLLDSIPVVRIPNYAFRNQGNLTFTDVTRSWGMEAPSFSNGAAFADLDNDGDLDFIVNNINDAAFVYENKLYTSSRTADENNFLRIRLNAPGNNPHGLGAKITLHYDSGKIQYQEFSTSRGYLSSVEDIVHFGLGKFQSIDSAVIVWPDGNTQELKSIKANQVLTIVYQPGGHNRSPLFQQSRPPDSDHLRVGVGRNSTAALVERVERKVKLLYRDEEQDKFDYNIQRTLPHKFTQSGPGLATGDVNGDGLEDILLGGSTGHNEALFFQKPDGTFFKKEIKNEHKIEEDEGVLLFDADNDFDLDLYVVSGSIEDVRSDDAYQDRLYLNDGKGDFALAKGALPPLKASGSCVRAADFDADGDLDLFVGGRVVLGSYPFPPESYLLRNDRGKFSNVTLQVCPELKSPGMITDALWTDFNLDGKIDLMVVGEFMPVTFFKNEGNKFTRVKISTDQQTGWWNSIAPGDFDRDGDIDYVIGNLGLNNYYQASEKFPLRVYGKDFDNNSSIDPVMASYMRESMDKETRKLYPVHFWDEISSQSPLFRRKFKSYRQYAMASVDKVFSPNDLKGALILEANQMASCYLENLGNEKFELKALPTLAQVAPVNGMITDDVNGDGNLDVVLVGNDYGNEVFAGRLDALTGLILLGNGKGSFKIIPSTESGFYVPGDAKALAKVSGVNGTLYLATQNRDSVRLFRKTDEHGLELQPKPMDTWAKLIHADGREERIEFYHGSGYLSQSTRRFRLPKDVKEVRFYNSTGQSRTAVP